VIDNGEHDTKIETSSFVPEQSIITYKIYSSIIFRYIFDPLIIVVKPRFVELNASHKTWPNVFFLYFNTYLLMQKPSTLQMKFINITNYYEI